MSHANAKLTEYGRWLLVSRIDQGWTQAQVAEAQGVSRSTAAKWWKRYREEGIEGLRDRSSSARRLPHALGETVVEAVCALRRELGAGPHRIAYELGLAASTVYGVLRRRGLSVLARLDRTTRAVIRYEREHPGDLIHLDVKRLGRIPDGGGKRFDPGFFESGLADTVPGQSVATTMSTSPSTTTPAMPTPRSLPTRQGPPRLASSPAPSRRSPSPASASAPCSRTTP